MKIFKLMIKLLTGIIIGAIALLGLAFIVLNVMQLTAYKDYLEVKENVAKHPGLNSGYAPQGLEYIKSIDTYITTAYSDNPNNASRIFLANDKSFDIYNIDGSKNHSHVGGIAVHETSNSLFVATEGTISRLLLSDLVTNKDNPGKIDIQEEFEVPFDAAFVFVYQDKLLTGEFYNGNQYMGKGYKFVSGEEESHALATIYDIDDLLSGTYEPIEYYALPDKVQGAAIHNGYIYFSTSYGLKNSYVYTYNLLGLTVVSSNIGGKTVDVKFLDQAHLVNSLKAPWMTEDLTINDGKLIMHFESACNKYIIGKLYFANKIVALDILK